MPDFYPSGNTARAADDELRSWHKLASLFLANPSEGAEVGSYLTTEDGEKITDEDGNYIVVG